MSTEQENTQQYETYIYKRGNQYAFTSVVLPTQELVVCVAGVNHYGVMQQLKAYMHPDGWFEGEEVENLVNTYLRYGVPESRPSDLDDLLKSNNIE